MEFTNLLALTLTENKLERNFKAIIEALMLSQDENQHTRDQLNQLDKNHSNDISELKDKIAQLENKVH